MKTLTNFAGNLYIFFFRWSFYRVIKHYQDCVENGKPVLFFTTTAGSNFSTGKLTITRVLINMSHPTTSRLIEYQRVDATTTCNGSEFLDGDAVQLYDGSPRTTSCPLYHPIWQWKLPIDSPSAIINRKECIWVSHKLVYIETDENDDEITYHGLGSVTYMYMTKMLNGRGLLSRNSFQDGLVLIVIVAQKSWRGLLLVIFWKKKTTLCPSFCLVIWLCAIWFYIWGASLYE